MTGRMIYLEPKPHASQPPPQGADKYYGAVAEQYDVKRTRDPKWTTEQTLIEGLLSDLPEGTTVLDCPVGTGRFIKFYASRKFKLIGMDKSPDMLMQAHRQNKDASIDGDLIEGDCRATKLRDKSVDVAVNCRITRWLSPDDCQLMLREMQRVARKRIIWTARVANHPHARTVELFEEALGPDWKLTENHAGYVTDYRILMAEYTGP